MVDLGYVAKRFKGLGLHLDREGFCFHVDEIVRSLTNLKKSPKRSRKGIKSSSLQTLLIVRKIMLPTTNQRDTKPRIPLHAWINCREILKKLNGNPYLFHRTRLTLIQEVRSRAILLLESPYFSAVDEIRSCLDSLEKLQAAQPSDFPVERQLELIPTVSPSGVVA